MNNIIRNLKKLIWLWMYCGILQAEVVITEFFILQADNSHAPQYVELYNNSDATISLENWSITTLDGNGDVILESPFDNSGWYVQANNIEIDPFGYFLISSSFCGYSTFGCNFYNGRTSDIIFSFLILPFDDPYWNYDDKGSIVLKNDTNNIIDSVGYNIANDWPVDEDSRGHSLRLHVAPDSDDKNNPANWSLSPESAISPYLYETGSEILNFGTPREENIFTTGWAANQGDIIITEFFFNKSAGNLPEYVELFNKTESTIDLNGWKVYVDGRSPIRYLEIRISHLFHNPFSNSFHGILNTVVFIYQVVYPRRIPRFASLCEKLPRDFLR